MPSRTLIFTYKANPVPPRARAAPAPAPAPARRAPLMDINRRVIPPTTMASAMRSILSSVPKGCGPCGK